MVIATVLSVFALLLISDVQQTKAIPADGISISFFEQNFKTEDMGPIVFILRREGDASGNISVNVSIEDFTTEPEDIIGPRTATITLVDGQESILFNVDINDDTLPEETEDFQVILTGDAVGSSAFASGFILDNDFYSTEVDEGPCSVTCGAGNRTENITRTCIAINPSNCELPLNETRIVACNPGACTNISEWTEWADDGTCSTTCGPGAKEQSRTRTCTPAASCPTDVTSRETRTVDCEICTCPVIGAWSPWANRGQCSVTCGDGTKTQARTRECTNPCTPCGCAKHEERTVTCNCRPCRARSNGEKDLSDISLHEGRSLELKSPHIQAKYAFDFGVGEIDMWLHHLPGWRRQKLLPHGTHGQDRDGRTGTNGVKDGQGDRDECQRDGRADVYGDMCQMTTGILQQLF